MKSQNSFTETLKNIILRRPKPLKELDQVHMNVESLSKTVGIVKKYVTGKNVVFLGDDDFISVGLSLATDINRASVLEIDDRIIETINGISKEIGKKIEVIKYDVRDNLPKDLVESFDFFYTNPPYGSKNKGESIKVFLDRCFMLLKKDCYGAFIAPMDENSIWASEGLFNIQKFILENGFIIVECINSFQDYIANDIKSSLYIIRKVNPETKRLSEDKIRSVSLY